VNRPRLTLSPGVVIAVLVAIFIVAVLVGV
jgi:hypothetical protein